jgi:hypothetical protein
VAMMSVKLFELPLVQLCERQSAPLEPLAEIRYQQHLLARAPASRNTGPHRHREKSESTPHDAITFDPPIWQCSAFLPALRRHRPSSHRCVAFNSRRATNPVALRAVRSFIPT